MTAWYAMHEVGGLRSGDKVLIHAASGGVGLAAVQVARRAGAEIFTTAGSKEKRAFLESLGVRHVFDSRSFDFAAEVMNRTGGRGLDVVLNSLTGEFIPHGLSILAAGGRFLELGKKEVYSHTQLEALSLRPGVTYHAIDLTGLQRDDPDAYGRLLREVMDQVRAGRFEVLPRHVFSLSEAPGAFRLMLQRRHIGKVVLSFAPRPPEVYCVRRGPAFRRLDKHLYVVNPGRAADYAALLAALESESAAVGRVAHLWNVTAAGRGPSSRNRSTTASSASPGWPRPWRAAVGRSRSTSRSFRPACSKWPGKHGCSRRRLPCTGLAV